MKHIQEVTLKKAIAMLDAVGCEYHIAIDSQEFGAPIVYSCTDGRISSILYGFVFGLSLELRLPVVRADKASNRALFPIAPSFSMISMFLMSSAGIASGHPP